MDADTQDLPSSRAEAKRLGRQRYFTGKPCKNGHVDVRRTSNRGCVTCLRERSREWYQNNPERHRRHRQRWYKENPEWHRRLSKRWKQDNPDLCREYDYARIASRLNRTPHWADREAIRLVYAEAQRLTEETGVEHHVDHVYPLQGRTVSGLHVAENLEAVPAHINLSKNNAYPDEHHRYEEHDD